MADHGNDDTMEAPPSGASEGTSKKELTKEQLKLYITKMRSKMKKLEEENTSLKTAAASSLSVSRVSEDDAGEYVIYRRLSRLSSPPRGKFLQSLVHHDKPSADDSRRTSQRAST